ncbi:MAG: T9SS type A sorting domain-containing protein [Taibaiella sp.]|nr:T9SS type A sorting domain-containing protein [Taibaiella sp.]
MKKVYSILFFLMPVLSSAQTISTIAGNGTWTCSGAGGAAVSAAVGQVCSVTTDNSGNVYIGVITCRKVFKIDAAGNLTTYVGTGVGGTTGDGGPATLATISEPTSIAMDRFGNLYISDGDQSVIRKVNAAGIISTIAGNPFIGGGYNGDGIPSNAALLRWPEGIATDTAGNVYFSDNGNHMVRKISTAGIISRVAGGGGGGYTGDGGSALLAGIPSATGITVDRNGNIYFSDPTSQRVRKINSAGIISCVAGSGVMGYSGDGGPATLATLRYPRGLAVDNYGNLFISDGGNSAIRMVNQAGYITNYAGTGYAGHSGDGGPAFLASISYPYDIATDQYGFKYIAELNGAYVRRVDSCLSPVVLPIWGDSVLCIGASTTMSDSSTGGAWSVSDTTVATIDASGTITSLTAGLLTVTYSIANSCVTRNAIKKILVGSYAGNISASFPTPVMGVDTFCYGVALETTGPVGGVWGLKNVGVSDFVSSGTSASVSGVIYGVRDTAYYAYTDTCGSDTAFYSFVLIWCPDKASEIVKDNENLKIFPNPTGNVLNLSSNTDIGRLSIVNSMGETVLSLNNCSNVVRIESQNLPRGVYFITTTAGKKGYFLKE